MKIIVDSNVIFSSILNTNSLIGDIILNSQSEFDFISCDYLKIELANHKSKILKLSGYTEQEYRELELILWERINFISEALIPFEKWKVAAEFVREVDMDDVAFVALSLFTEAPIWTGDRKLRDGLVKKGFDNVLTTREIQEIRIKNQ